MPKVSLIIPVYNGKKTVLKCLKSICMQSFVDIQVLIIDDGSADGSYEYIKHFISTNRRYFDDISVELYTRENRGAAFTRNEGIEKASGKYIVFADQDDFFLKDMIKHYIQTAERSEADIVVGGYERVDIDNKIINHVELFGKKFDKFIVTAPWAHMYKRDFLIKNDIKFLNTGMGEDVYFNVLAYSHTDKIVSVKGTDYKWLYNRHSVSNTKQIRINKNADPLILLRALSNDCSINFINDPETEYFFLRYICWYMLYSVRGSRKKNIIKMYRRLDKWLDDVYSDWKSNIYIGMKYPEGEKFSIHTCVFIYYLLKRMHILENGLLLFGR